MPLVLIMILCFPVRCISRSESDSGEEVDVKTQWDKSTSSQASLFWYCWPLFETGETVIPQSLIRYLSREYGRTRLLNKISVLNPVNSKQSS